MASFGMRCFANYCVIPGFVNASRNLASKHNATCLRYTSRKLCSETGSNNGEVMLFIKSPMHVVYESSSKLSCGAYYEIDDNCKKCYISVSVPQDRVENPPQNELHVRDPAPYFFSSNVQDILRRITGVDLQRIYSKEPRRKFQTPRFEFMTEEKLRQVLDEAKKKAITKLQMPPVLKARQPINDVLSYDPELTGFDPAKYVFVDISHGLSDRSRAVVVRDPDGTLRNASWEERDKMNRIFFPVERRKTVGIPRMFFGEYFERILDEEKYEFILDRACLQFEPDDPLYIKVCHRVYDCIDRTQKYDLFISTRHYGPMAFYFAFYTSIDNLLLHLIKKDRINIGADVVRLYQSVNPQCKSLQLSPAESDLSLIKAYMNVDSHKKSNLELAIQTYEELQRQQQQYEQGIREAHGQA